VTFDVVVVGAGPAGSAAAYRLASDGWRVALLERSDEPGKDDVCGGMVSLPMVKRFGVFPDAVEKGMRCELHVLPWGVIENITEQCTFQRRVFDRLLARRAVAAGAELMAWRCKIGTYWPRLFNSAFLAARCRGWGRRRCWATLC